MDTGPGIWDAREVAQTLTSMRHLCGALYLALDT